MLEYHKEKQAACTIAVLNVPLEEASRFGVMNTDENLKIYEFEEKAAQPKSTLASMWRLYFQLEKLKAYLVAMERIRAPENDSGGTSFRICAGGGTYVCLRVQGLLERTWERSNLFGKRTWTCWIPMYPIELNDPPPWKIYSRNGILPPQYIGSNAKLNNVTISEGCSIDGEIENSIIFPGVSVMEGAVIRNSILMPGVTVGKDSTVEYTIIAAETAVGDNVCMGACSAPAVQGRHPEITVIGLNRPLFFPANCHTTAQWVGKAS